MKSFARSWIAGLSLLVLSCGCANTQRLYEGNPLPATQVARVHNSNNVYVTAVDGAELKPGYANTCFELLPGEHRLVVMYYKVTGVERQGDYIVTHSVHGNNQQTLRAPFEAGKEYEFAVETQDNGNPRAEQGDSLGLWKPMLVEKGGSKIIATPEIAPPPPMPRRAVATASPTSRPAGTHSSSGTSVVGVARQAFADGMVLTAAGRDVLLIPRTIQNEDWFEQRIVRAGMKAYQPIGRDRDEVLARGGRYVLGYGTGQFEFTDVPPGNYIVFFQIVGKDVTWYPRAYVSVRAGQEQVNAGQLTLRPGGLGSLSQ
jgi:hypothetical protein